MFQVAKCQPDGEDLINCVCGMGVGTDELQGR